MNAACWFKQIFKATLHKNQLYGQIVPSKKKVRRTRYAEHCWRNKNTIISDVLLSTSTQGHTSVG